jgi:hypothetical protein
VSKTRDEVSKTRDEVSKTRDVRRRAARRRGESEVPTSEPAEKLECVSNDCEVRQRGPGP